VALQACDHRRRTLPKRIHRLADKSIGLEVCRRSCEPRKVVAGRERLGSGAPQDDHPRSLSVRRQRFRQRREELRVQCVAPLGSVEGEGKKVVRTPLGEKYVSHSETNSSSERASSRGFSTGIWWPASGITSNLLPLIPAAMISAAFGGQCLSRSEATISVGAVIRSSSGSSGEALSAAIAAQALP